MKTKVMPDKNYITSSPCNNLRERLSYTKGRRIIRVAAAYLSMLV